MMSISPQLTIDTLLRRHSEARACPVEMTFGRRRYAWL